MLLMVRLAALCLSLALLGGLVLHDLAGAKLTIDMARAAAPAPVSMSGPDLAPTVTPAPALTIAAPEGAALRADDCAACGAGDPAALTCNWDCTAPVFSTESLPLPVAVTLHTSLVAMPGDMALAGLDPGADPFPPRNIFLS
ncbi:hypothetical protein [Brevirhabdus sp.]|uniref:hypothetical protein n=1 Tax=Brevirhabdus sp. TaxID=2004514 RepID=UPI0040592CB3